MSVAVALYLHIPFCQSRCAYCDFNTYAGLEALQPRYVQGLLQEMRLMARPAPLAVSSIYFGGGTPALLPAADIAALLDEARRVFAVQPGAEITLEANPGVVRADELAALRRAGVNRLSLGVQSAHDAELCMLGRIHTWAEARSAVALARAAGFVNLTLDLIYGLPGQTLAAWEASLERVLALAPQHLSLYALTPEAETPLARALARGDLPPLDPDLAADMYEAASERLRAAGFWQYEISNWALGTTSPPEVWAIPPAGVTESIGPWVGRHNLSYWRNTAWLGLGAGAHSWLAGRRFSNPAAPQTYLAGVEAGRLAYADTEVIAPELERGETLMLGLRLAEGVTAAQFRARFGLNLAEVYAPQIQQLAAQGLVAWDGERLRLTPRGRLLGNRVFGEFLP